MNLGNLIAGFCVLLGLFPFMGTVAGLLPASFVWLTALNAIAWISCGCLFMLRADAKRNLRTSLVSLDLPVDNTSVEAMLRALSSYQKRLAKMLSRLSEDATGGDADLGAQLQEITETAFEELHANSVELALFDDNSGLWTQAILLGTPRSDLAQSLLAEAANESEVSKEALFAQGILLEPVVFAGSRFGLLRVEIEDGATPSKTDVKILQLLALQSALSLVNARFTDELLRMKRLSEESVKAKTGFLANLSHEIRGPLGVILSGVELMTEGLCGEVTNDQRDTLKMIKQNGDHLLDLVNDVLDYAKAEAGKLKAKPVELGIKTLLSDLTNVVRSQATAKHHKLITQPVEPTLGLICDKRHIRQILINMLTNAIKYTPENGTVTISAERVRGERVKVSVSDTGIGIADSEKAKVFSAFERVDDKYAQTQIGTGLGMPITRKLAELNGGWIDFDSEEGKGSTFWVVLPATEVRDLHEESPERVVAMPQELGKGEDILLVAPETEERTVFMRYLAHQGFEVVPVGGGNELMKILRERNFSAALVDNDFAELTGEDLIGIIRNNPTAKELPVALLSAKAFVFDIERFLKLGVDRCLTKPVELRDVAITIRQLIDEAVCHPGQVAKP